MSSSRLIPLLELVEHATVNVDSLCNSQKSIANRNEMASWKDEAMIKLIGQLKVASECVSDSMTKLTLICSKYPDQIESLLPEVSNHINILIHIYCKFTELKSCQSLFLSVSHSIKTLLLHIQELIQMLIRKEFDQCSRSGTGMIWKAVKEISELPVTNKGSYRRDIMEDIATIADTIREFEGYLIKSNENINNNNNSGNSSSNSSSNNNHNSKSMAAINDNEIDDNDDDEDEEEDNDEDDEDEDDNEDYNESEFPIIHQTIELIKSSADLLKLALQIMSFVADSLCIYEIEGGSTENNNTDNVKTIDTIHQGLQSLTIDTNITATITTAANSSLTISSSSSSSSLSKTTYSTPIEKRNRMIANTIGIQLWISEMIQIKSYLSNSITDLGCELYPPINEAPIAKERQIVIHFSHVMIELLLIYENNMTNEMKQSVIELKNQFLLN